MRGAVPILVASLPVAACVPGGHAATSAFDPSTAPPKIVDLTVSCDGEKGAWSMAVTTDAWAGGGALVWTLDGVYLEKQTGFRSVAAQADGKGDLLRDDIGIVTDFRPYQDGVTAFSCRDAPSGAFYVLGLDRKPSDCVRLGPAPELVASIKGFPPCPRVFVPSDTDGGDSDGGDSDVGDTN